MTNPYRLVEARHGRFLVNPQDTYIGRSMAEYGEFSELELSVMLQGVRDGAVVIEAGANIGAFTVPLARAAGPGGLVYAFEPQPLVFQLLCANVALNGLLNVQAFNAACGEKAGRMGVRRVDPARATNHGGIPLDRLESDTAATRIRIEKLDEAVAPPRLDLIKADVEGMELAVLKGAAGLIRRFRPVLYVECHAPQPPLLRWLAKAGYKAWWHLPQMFNPQNKKRRPDNIWGAPVRSVNLVCIPADRAGPMTSFRPVAGPEDHPSRWT